MATLSELQEDLALYRAARNTILQGSQSYSIGNQTYTKGDLRFIQQQIDRLEQQIAITSQGGRFSHSVTVFGGRR